MNWRFLSASLFLGVLTPISAYAQQAGTNDKLYTVYRCEANGAILYTTRPERGCVVVTTLRAGAVAPVDVTRTPHGESAVEVFRRAAPSVVVVTAYDRKGKATELGSGVKLPDGLVATNCHVLKGGFSYRVRYAEREYVATMADADWQRDVCTINAAGLPAPAIVLGSTSGLEIGTRVFAIGTPEGLQQTLSEGIVSSLRPSSQGNYIQTTAPISPGSSGGGLFDSSGRLLGLTSFFVKDGQQLNFALPVEWIETLVRRPSHYLRKKP